MDRRPKNKLPLSPLDHRLETAGVILFIVMWVFTIYSYLKLPSIVALHFNPLGKVDRYGNKINLFLLPIIATVTHLGLTILCRYPHLFNYPVKITEANAQKQYTIAARMLRYVQLLILFLFTFIVGLTYFTSTGKLTKLGVWVLPLLIISCLMPVVIALKQFAKNK